MYTNCVIQFQGVTKRYKGNDFVIDDVSFSIEPGEFVFLIGPSGSGKTTVIKLLIREELPTNGKIYFDDFDITRLSRNSVYKLRRQLGVVFQDYKLIPDKTVYENVAFAMEVAGKTDKEIKETVPYLLDIVGLSSRAKAFPDHLSGGEKQRVAIARAVSNNPRVLIADEPTGNLDPGAAWDIVQILTKINNWGTTVIMSTHGSDIVNTLNKRVIQMFKGKVVRDDSQGYYESMAEKPLSTDDPHALELDSDLEIEPEERKGPIKVQMKTVKAATPAPKRRLFGLFGSRATPVADLETEEELAVVVERAIQSPVSELHVSEEVLSDLEIAGYETVEDIVESGPSELGARLGADYKELEEVATAIEQLVEEKGVDLEEVMQDSDNLAVENQKTATQVEQNTAKSKKTTKKAVKAEKVVTELESQSEIIVESEIETDSALKESEEAKPEAKPKGKAQKVKVDLTAKPKN